MTKSRANRFTKPTILVLAKRAGFICSNPYCQSNTSGPHSDVNKSVNLGEAAHIRGAEVGSARYDPAMTSEERRSITNGIWLCNRCAKIVDNDEKNYTVDILYRWKQNHEISMEASLHGKQWERRMRFMNIGVFQNESLAVQQIVIDKPAHWEYFLTLELLRPKMDLVKRQFDELERGLTYRPMRPLTDEQFISWIRGKINDLQTIIHVLMLSATEELPRSWGKPGESGDETEIKYATDKIIEGCKALLEWEIDIYFTLFPYNYEVIQPQLKGWMKDFLSEMDRIPCEIAKILTKPNPEETHVINLVFRSPQGIEEVSGQIATIAKRKS
jgi:hypothetical protein